MKILIFSLAIIIILAATTLASGKILKLNAKNFNDTVYRLDRKTLVHFFAPWDGPSKRSIKSFKQLSESDYVLKEHPELDLAQLDVTKHPSIPEEQGVEQWPTLMLYKNGRRKGRDYTGRKQYEDLISFLNTFLDYDEEKAEKDKAEREEEARLRQRERARKIAAGELEEEEPPEHPAMRRRGGPRGRDRRSRRSKSQDEVEADVNEELDEK
jgi:thioredoxin-like negative regulator of GroEL